LSDGAAGNAAEKKKHRQSETIEHFA